MEYIVKAALTSGLSGSIQFGVLFKSVIPATFMKLFQITSVRFCLTPFISLKLLPGSS